MNVYHHEAYMGRPQTAETRAKIAQALSGRKWLKASPLKKARVEYTMACKVCGNCFTQIIVEGTKKRRKTCSAECYAETRRTQGQRSASVQAEQRRSKNEKLFAQMCEKHFAKVETNLPMFGGWDADVIIHDHKIAVLWNGKWHYEKITEKHSVEQVQNRDRLKIKAITAAGFVPYVIKDLGSFDLTFVQEQFSGLVNWLSRSSHKAE